MYEQKAIEAKVAILQDAALDSEDGYERQKNIKSQLILSLSSL